MSASAEQLVQGAVELSSLPEIYYRLSACIDDPHSNLSGIGEIVSTDPVLSARLLKIANSALFNFPSPVESINQAITVVGTAQLRDLVLSTSVIDMFRGIFGNLVSMDSFWRHSIACGITARVIATYRREANIERYYVIGLLHDIGKLVMQVQLTEAARQAIYQCRQDGHALYQTEQTLIGFDHAAVGGALLRAWKLPESLAEPVGCHHQPQLAGQYPEDAAIVHVADIITNALEIGASGEARVPPLQAEAWVRLGLSENLLPDVVAQVDAHYLEALELFLEGGA